MLMRFLGRTGTAGNTRATIKVPTAPSDRGEATMDYGDSILGMAERELAALISELS